jgi:nitroimidazol reductase NimA-like FMN-containing flavoprotein (pyridoxamine 5'-phosphate oxidase superfamily)
MERFEQTVRTTVKRLPKRAEYSKEKIYEILDEGFVCHIGFVTNGQPVVIPTAYARVADRLFIHGSAASRMLKTLSEGIDVCVTITLVDGLVLARSAFHHSMNYRSVVVFGKANVVENSNEKMEALRAFTDHIVPNRWDAVRWPNESEMKATTVLALPLTEASAKIRTGGPIDDEEDYELNVWAGMLPIRLQTYDAIPDERLKAGIKLPDEIRNYNGTFRQKH